jgi:cytochrome P450
MTTQSTAAAALPGPRRGANARAVRQLFSDPATALDSLRTEYGPICGLGYPGVRLAIIGDPALMHEMFSMKADSFRWNHKFNVIGVRFVVGKQSMIVSDGADHQRRRGAVQRAFTRPRLNGWIPMILQRTDAAIDQLTADLEAADGPRPVDLYPVGRDLILGITIHAFFGERLAHRTAEFSDLFQRAQAFIEAPAVKQLPHPFPNSARSRVRADRRVIDRIIDEEVADRRARPAGNPLDILETLALDSTLSDAEIRDQVDTLIGAGYDTTASTLAWLLLRAAADPEVWHQLRAEADLVLGPPDGSHTPSDAPPNAPPNDRSLAGLEYAQRVVRESLRVHPAGLIGARVAATDLQIGGRRIRKGTLIVWSPHLAGRDPNTWADPLRFDPDRHRNPTAEQKAANDQAWVPFGRGPHMCIGFALAQMELTLIIARLAQRLDLTATSTAIPRPVGMVVNRPEGGAPFHISPRP